MTESSRQVRASHQQTDWLLNIISLNSNFTYKIYNLQLHFDTPFDYYPDTMKLGS
jgi:hypothetical protein